MALTLYLYLTATLGIIVVVCAVIQMEKNCKASDMADLMKLMKDNWRAYSQEERRELLMSNFNRQERRKFKRDGDLNELFKNYCQ